LNPALVKAQHLSFNQTQCTNPTDLCNSTELNFLIQLSEVPKLNRKLRRSPKQHHQIQSNYI